MDKTGRKITDTSRDSAADAEFVKRFLSEIDEDFWEDLKAELDEEDGDE